MKRCRLHNPNPNPNPKKKNKKPESNANSLQPDSVIISSLERLRSQSQSSSSSSKMLTLREKDQSQSDDAVVDSRLPGDGVVGRPGGVVIGRLILTMEGDRIDCNKIGVSGMIIPPNVDYVGNLESDALFILLVEDDDLFMRIVDDKFYEQFSCIIIRPNIIAKGQPDGATGTFLRLLKTELKLPVLALVDSDPYGLKTLSVYMCSSDSANLTTLDIKWLGMRPSDLDKYQIPDWCRLPMTDQDLKVVKDLLEDFVKRNKGWVMELEMMLKMRQKVEIVALCSFGFQYITETYLPLKLQQQDWL